MYCGVFEHFSLFKKTPDLMEFFPGYNTWEDIEDYAEFRYEEDYQSFYEQIEPNEHPAWHCFNESTENNLMKAIYDAGFIRFGTYLNKFNERIVETESLNPPNKDYVMALMAELGAVNAICNRSWRSDYSSNRFFKL
jgi:hypothetical protein